MYATLSGCFLTCLSIALATILHLPFKNHFVQGTPASESYVLSYFWNHSMPRSSFTAFQYHSISLFAFLTSWHQLSMSCFFMNLPILLLAIWSAEGTNMNRSVNKLAFDETFNICT